MSHELEIWTRIGATLWAQSGIVLLLGLLAAKMLRRRGPVAKMMVLRAALTGVAIVAVLSLVAAGRVRTAWHVQLPQFSAPQTVVVARASAANDANHNTPGIQTNDANAPNFDQATPPAISLTDAPMDAESSTRLPDSTSPEAVTASVAQDVTKPHAQRFGVYQLIAIMWACGALMLLSWLLFCSVRVAFLRRQSAVVTSGLWHQTLSELCTNERLRQPLLLQSAQVRSPFLMGLWRPAIVLPADELISDEASIRAVLLHELTHWRRRDLWWNLAARLIGIVLWPQPLLWIANRETERAAEEVCDLSVVQGGCAAKDYARCLLDLSERLTLRPVERTVAAGVVPRQSALASRVKRILDVSRRQEMKISRRVRVVAAVLTLGAIGLSVSLVSVEAKNENAPQQLSTHSSTRKVDLSSPEGVVRSFADAINAKDLDEAVRYIEGGAPIINRDLQARVAAAKFSVAVSDFKTKIEGTTAIVTLREAETIPVNENYDLRTQVRQTTMSLRQSNKEWKIVSVIRSVPGQHDSLLQEATGMLTSHIGPKMTAWAKNRGKASIVGRVLDDNGRPVPGARIHVTMISDDILRQLDGRNTVYQAEMMNIAPRVRALFSQYIQTKSDGTFRVNGLTSANYSVEALPIPERRIPRLIPTGSLHIAAREGSSTRSPNLKMSTGAVVSVRVVESATRKPLSGVELALNAIRNHKQVFYTSGKTDANGRALLGSLQGRSYIMLRSDVVKGLNGLYVVSNGVPYLPLPKAGDTLPRPLNSTYAAGQSVFVSRDTANEVVFKLQRYVAPKTAVTSVTSSWNEKAAPIRGRVVDADGRPAAGARVMLQPTNEAEKSKEYQAWRRLREKAMLRVLAQGRIATTYPATPQLFAVWTKFGFADTTRADGTYRLSGLELTYFNVLVVPVPEINTHHLKNGSFLLDSVATAAQIRTPPARTTELVNDIVLTRGGLMNVQVVDDTTGKSLPRIYVFAQTWRGTNSGSPTIANTNNAQGRATFRVVPGRVRVSFLSAYKPRQQRNLIAADGKLYDFQPAKVLVNGEETPATFGGTVVTVTKDQTANVQIRLKTYVVPIPVPTPPMRPLTRAAAILTGRVVYADGHPAAGVRMGVWFQPEAARSNELSAWDQPLADAVGRLLIKDGGKLTARQTLNKIFDIRRKFGQADITRADGTYRLSVMASTRFNVLVDTDKEIYVNRPSYVLPDWVEMNASPTGIAPKMGATAQVADVVLTRGVVIRGRVLDRTTGRPLSNVFITWHRPLNQPSGVAATSARTDAQGRYAMRVSPSARFVYIGGNGYMGGTYIGVKHLTATVHSGDSPPYVKELDVIKIGNDLYDPNAWMQVQLDNAAPRWMQSGPATRHFEIPAQLGQTRTLNFRLDKLVVKRKGRAVDVYIPAKPR